MIFFLRIKYFLLTLGLNKIEKMQLLKKISKWQFLLEKKQLSSNYQKVEFKNYSDISNVLILCSIDRDADFEQIKLLLNILIQDGKKVTVLCCVWQKKSLLQNSEDHIFIKKEEISCKDKPNDITIKWLKTNEFDAVFNISLTTHIPMLYLLLYSRAKLKCGGKIQVEGLLDFIIDTSNCTILSEKYLLEQIIFYLKKI
jgi:hypothetical protein